MFYVDRFIVFSFISRGEIDALVKWKKVITYFDEKGHENTHA